MHCGYGTVVSIHFQISRCPHTGIVFGRTASANLARTPDESVSRGASIIV